MSKLDLTKPVQCKDGKPVKILWTNLKASQPVVGIVKLEDGSEQVRQWDEDGSYFGRETASNNDLINVPEKKTALVVFCDDKGLGFTTPHPESYNQDGFSIVKVEYTVGQKDL